MSNLQVGTFVLNAELLIFIAAGIVGVLAVRYRQRTHPEREWIVNVAWNAVFLWLGVWKGSLLIYDPASVIENPMSLVFFSGGAKGIWLASVLMIGYMTLRYARRLGTAQAAPVTVTMLAGGLSTVYLARLVLIDSAGGYSYTVLALSFAMLVWLLSPSMRYAAQTLGVLLVVTMIAYTVLEPAEKKSIRNDQPAPEFQLTDLNGNVVSLSDYRGKTVLMNFWATWCQVCKAEMPHVEKLYEKYKGEDIVILSVNVTSQERNVQLVERYVDKHSLSFPIVLDEAGTVAKQYKVTAFPTTYIIDSAGVIQDRRLGAVSYEDMKRAIRDIG